MITVRGGLFLLSREINLYETYGLHVEKTGRGRGGTIYHCREGVFLLKPYPASEKRGEVLYRILSDWEKQGLETDVFIRSKEDKIPVMDGYQNIFVLRKWFDGAESDVMNEEEVLAGVRKLVEFQELVAGYVLPEDCVFSVSKTTKEQLIKHTRELQYVHNYIRDKNHKSELEEQLRGVFGDCYRDAKQAIEVMEKTDEGHCRYQLCHKDYTHHNLIMTKTGVRLVGFDNMMPDSRVGDFAQYLRKVMEKHNWDESFGGTMVQQYVKDGRLSDEEKKDLYARMLYPTRFWKIMNHYGNTRKTGVNLRDREKLDDFLRQEERRQQFLVFLHSLIV